MDKQKLDFKALEELVGGLGATISPESISDLLYEAWEMKVVKHCSKEEVISTLCNKVTPVQRAELTDLINQYWDKLV